MLRLGDRMHQPFMAIDPGTHLTGIAFFQENKPVHWDLITAPRKLPAHERIALILQGIQEYHANHASTAVAAVSEKPAAGTERNRPAPELQTLIRSIRAWAKGTANRSRNRMDWVEYNPSTVAASVALKGFPKAPGGAKQRITAGVTALYPDVLKTGPLPIPQDVLDAIAVGHCHLTSLLNSRLEADAF